MSDDLISRQAAIDDAHSQIWYRLNPNMKERMDTWLVNLPSVQPEQKTATFYVDSEGYERCSACNEYESGMRYFNFCPNCGAKMESEKSA